MLIIFGLSSLKGSDIQISVELWSGTDKLVHACIYFAYGFLTSLTLVGTKEKQTYLKWLATALVVLVGCCDEFYQLHVPGRDGSIYDVVADVFGGALAIWIAHPRFCIMVQKKKN